MKCRVKNGSNEYDGNYETDDVVGYRSECDAFDARNEDGDSDGHFKDACALRDSICGQTEDEDSEDKEE